MSEYESITERALQAFWSVVAEDFPSVTTGDLAPDIAVRLSSVARDAVGEWVRTNAPWIAGWNMPGCLPEVPAERFSTWAEAHAYLRAEVDRWADESDHDSDAHAGMWSAERADGCDACESEVTLATLDSIATDDSGQPFTVMHSYGPGMVLWVARAESDR